MAPSLADRGGVPMRELERQFMCALRKFPKVRGTAVRRRERDGKDGRKGKEARRGWSWCTNDGVDGRENTWLDAMDERKKELHTSEIGWEDREVVAKTLASFFGETSTKREHGGNGKNLKLVLTWVKMRDLRYQGMHEAHLEVEMPEASVHERAAMINSLLRKKELEILREGQQLVYRSVDKEEAVKYKGLNAEELLVYQSIKDSSNIGIWTRDLRHRCNLQQPQIKKIVKVLESRKLIKSVKSVLQKNRVVYMCYEVEPSTEITGGAWYTEQELDSEFIGVLQEACYKFIANKERLGLVTLEMIHAFIKSAEIARVVLTLEEVRTLVETLIYDGRVEMNLVGSTKDSPCYRVARLKTPESPCHVDIRAGPRQPGDKVEPIEECKFPSATEEDMKLIKRRRSLENQVRYSPYFMEDSGRLSLEESLDRFTGRHCSPKRQRASISAVLTCSEEYMPAELLGSMLPPRGGTAEPSPWLRAIDEDTSLRRLEQLAAQEAEKGVHEDEEDAAEEDRAGQAKYIKIRAGEENLGGLQDPLVPEEWHDGMEEEDFGADDYLFGEQFDDDDGVMDLDDGDDEGAYY